MGKSSKLKFGLVLVLGIGVPSLSYADIGSLPFASSAKLSIDRLRAAYEGIQANADVRMLLQNPKSSLTLSQRVTDGEMETTKFQAYYQGLEVIGSMALHHRSAQVTDVSDLLAHFDLDTHPTLTAEQATALAASLTDRHLELAGAPVLKILPQEDDSSSARLIYWIHLKGDARHAGHKVLIDAHNGSVIADISAWETLAPINVYQTNSGCQLLDESGAPAQLDLESCDKTVSNSRAQASADASARRALKNSQAVLRYYLNTHGRDSYDGYGSEVTSVVHVGLQFDNAFWDTDNNIMAYGDGDGETFGDFTRAVDVAGHEMTHGVTAATADLLPYDESGSLNEAFSDYFGKLIADDGNWEVGKEIFIDSRNGGIRNLADPHALNFTIPDATGAVVKRPYPAKVSEKMTAHGRCDGSNDECYVHINSTIPSHASYLVNQAIGRDRAEKLYFRVLTQMIGKTTNFRTLTSAVLKACDQMYDSDTCQQVSDVYDSVGMSSGSSRTTHRTHRTRKSSGGGSWVTGLVR